MTRINVGIKPGELCDQHLLAEWKEAWRALRPHKSKPPKHFKLGTGHETWCSQYPGSVKWRLRIISYEMEYRGFENRRELVEACNVVAGRYWPADEAIRARELLKERIVERLTQMKNPVWTNRKPPAWAQPALS